MTKHYDKVWINATIAQFAKDNTLLTCKDYFLAVTRGKIAKIDKMVNFNSHSSREIVDVKGKLMTASLIDCHTHLVYGGNRANEFEQRLLGETYADIAKNGGGINATIRSTREESFDKIYESSAKRLKALIQEGVTTIEIKTGYGLDIESEIKMLKIAEKLEQNFPVHVEKTFLGAHCVPPEYKNDSQSYINYICETMMDTISTLGLVTCVDVYCEHLAFSLEQTKRVFLKAKSLGLHVKIHSDQFSQMGATKLACEFDALSCDHLEYTDEESVIAMAKSGSVAVILPGAYYFLSETKKPPIELFRKHKVKMAVATDLNPGTSPLCSLLLMLNMSSVLFGLNVSEAFLAVTKNAACALGLENRKGSLEKGYDADFCIWDVEHPRDLVCTFMPNSLFYSVKGGERIHV